MTHPTPAAAGPPPLPPLLLPFAVPDTPAGTLFLVPDVISAAEEDFLLGRVDAAPASRWTVLRGRRLQSWGGRPAAAAAPVVAAKPHASAATAADASLQPGPQQQQQPQPPPMLAEPLPPWLASFLADRLRDYGVFAGISAPAATAAAVKAHPGAFNHCLVNEYLPGQGIMPHEDGPAYHPVVATVSLGSHAVLRFAPTRARRRRLRLHDTAAVSHERDAGAENDDGSDDDDAAAEEGCIVVPPRSLFVVTGEMYTEFEHAIDGVETDTVAVFCDSTTTNADDGDDDRRRDTSDSGKPATASANGLPVWNAAQVVGWLRDGDVFPGAAVVPPDDDDHGNPESVTASAASAAEPDLAPLPPPPPSTAADATLWRLPRETRVSLTNRIAKRMIRLGIKR
ncbi:Alpha-ketoglutarate-dependent dioxygenase alkB 6 [Cladochytrium tenue]|nr:Alpha-ketoglutarate-dependent dioxygenase alkB 6 [Cladochytrium tenue]